MKLRDIRPNSANPRQIKDESFKKLCKSVKEFPRMLELRPIVVDRDGTILGGNMRYRALVSLGYKEIPDEWVRYADTLTEDEKRRFIIEDNVDFGQWDFEKLANEWDPGELEDWGVEVPDLERSALQEAVEDDFNEEEVTEAVCKRGEVWQLGEHRLMCGDSTSKEDFAKLMGEERADMVFTDPPYGMKKEAEGVINDNLNYDDLLEFNKKWIPLSFANLKDNGSWYCWGIIEPLMDIYNNILKPMKQRNECTFRNLITWNKGDSGAGGVSFIGKDGLRSFPIATEFCLFVMCGVQGFNNNQDNYFEGWEPVRQYLAGEAKRVELDNKKLKEICGVGMYSHWFTKSQFALITEEHYRQLQEHYREYGAFKREYEELKREYYATRAYFDNTHDMMTDVWEFHRTRGEEKALCGGHATPKPIALCARGIKTSSKEGDIVLDAFGGSGTTMIAAEQLGRKCRMMELDPHYCDVIIARWEQLTGKKAIKISNP